MCSASRPVGLPWVVYFGHVARQLAVNLAAWARDSVARQLLVLLALAVVVGIDGGYGVHFRLSPSGVASAMAAMASGISFNPVPLHAGQSIVSPVCVH